MADEFLRIQPMASAEETEGYRRLRVLLERCPIPAGEILANLGLYLTRASLSRILLMEHLYREAIAVHGILVEFGVRWGQNLALLASLRNILEPHNYSRRIVGFDTFTGLSGVSTQDGQGEAVREGGYAVGEDYRGYLDEIMAAHELLAPRSHLRRFELVQGDVRETLPEYFRRHPETIIALAYFDLDLYEPTRSCLEQIRPFLTKGSVLGFDELTLAAFPGETVALREAWGLASLRLKRHPAASHESYVVLE
ncbi:MAG TPA: class I SAM-dependent methyltransferase [Anaeromyxobacteraceae bacterium]|nr:class I SAM-dependent methyltransferase [Anaeromyxobacteraceae bacterium]